MAKFLKFFFLLHFFLIIYSAIRSTMIGYAQLHKNEWVQSDFIKNLNYYLLGNDYSYYFSILSGTNTGYGFYGSGVSPEKYFEVELLGRDSQLIRTDVYFNLTTKNGFSRLQTLASETANKLADIEHDLQKENNSPSRIEWLKLKGEHASKVCKYLGAFVAKKEPNCYFYKVKLYTIVPPDIWAKNQKEKTVYVIKEFTFNK